MTDERTYTRLRSTLFKEHEELFPKDMPGAFVKADIFAAHAGKDGAIVDVYPDEGVAIEFWDRSPWEFFAWDELENADDIKAALAARVHLLSCIACGSHRLRREGAREFHCLTCKRTLKV